MTQEELKKLKIGDVVVLNSDSIKMTVSEIDNNYVSVHYWNTISNSIVSNTFDYAQLTIRN